MTDFNLYILGCASATPTRRHQPSSQVIDYGGKLMMVDCGEGAQLQFRRCGLKFSRLRHIFISHLHGDHLFGLPGLLSTMALHQTAGAVTIHIFERGAQLLRDFLRPFLQGSGLEIVYAPFAPGKTETVYEDKSLNVTAFPLHHRVDCSGFVFAEKPHLRHINGEMVRFYGVPVSRMQAIKEGADFVTAAGVTVPNARLTTDPDPVRSYAYCSDTMFHPDVAKAIKGVTTLYHEATYDDAFAASAAERGHSTARQAAKIASMAGVDKLVIGHYSKRYDSEDLLLAQAREEFGHVIAANEGMVIPV